MAQTKHFFVSYTQSDRQWAEWVAWELQEAGYTCTIQAWHFAPSQSFIQRMRQALVETRHLVAILSEEYLASEFAGAELDAALASDPRGLRAKLIPVRVKPCAPDELLRSRIYIDLVGKSPAQARNDLRAGIDAARATATPEGSVRFDKPPEFPAIRRMSPTRRPNRFRNLPKSRCCSWGWISVAASTFGRSTNRFG